MTLHVYEKVELELGPLLPGPDSVFRCPVRLFLDPSCPLRYLASHSAGLHQVKKVELELGPLLPGPDSMFRCASSSTPAVRSATSPHTAPAYTR